MIAYQNETLTFEKQTKLSGNGVRGNCMITCYANIMGLPISECPSPEEHFGDERHWFCDLYEWLVSKGWDYEYLNHDETLDDEVFYMAYGLSPRDNGSGKLLHQVIYMNGKLFFDPHPEGGGILDVRGYTLIYKCED